MNVDVHVYTTDAGLWGKVVLGRESMVDDVRVTYYSTWQYLDVLGGTGWQYSPQLAAALKRNISTYHICYINALWNYPVAVAAYWCRAKGVPYVIAPRGTYYPLTRAKKTWKKLPYYYFISKRDLKHAAAIHFTSEDEKEKCFNPEWMKGKPLVIPNGIDVESFMNHIEPKKKEASKLYAGGRPQILFLGRISWKKGLDILIEALSLMKRRGCLFHLVIAGNDEENYTPSLEKMMKEKGLSYVHADGKDEVTMESDVSFAGPVRGQAKVALLKSSHLFVLPSYSENFGISVVEAMAAGLPVIISDQVGIQREVLTHEAGCVVPVDACRLAKEMEELLGSALKRKELSRKGIQLVANHYDIKGVANRMKDAFQKVVRRV